MVHVCRNNTSIVYYYVVGNNAALLWVAHFCSLADPMLLLQNGCSAFQAAGRIEIWNILRMSGHSNYLYLKQHKTRHCNKICRKLPCWCKTRTCLCFVRKLTFGSIFVLSVASHHFKCTSVILERNFDLFCFISAKLVHMSLCYLIHFLTSILTYVTKRMALQVRNIKKCK
jgi:hypothetical protein